jgi:hypothetical protein
MTLGRRPFGIALFGAVLVLGSVGVYPGPTAAVDVGQAAPEFTLPSTTGVDISLSDFKGKKFVFLEFYGADFSPT